MERNGHVLCVEETDYLSEYWPGCRKKEEEEREAPKKAEKGSEKSDEA